MTKFEQSRLIFLSIFFLTLLTSCAIGPSSDSNEASKSDEGSIKSATTGNDIVSAGILNENDSTSLLETMSIYKEGTAPSGPTCDQLETAKWDDISLYNLTYGCIPRGWTVFFKRTDVREEIQKISDMLENELSNGYSLEPQIGNVFKALYSTTPKRSKAIILGQDPAPQPGVAMGLSFSTKPGVSSGVTASIQRVLLSAQNQGYCVNLDDGNLQSWADQGVLLLNMALSIRCEADGSDCAEASHVSEWQSFTRKLFEHIDDRNESKAFIFWGVKAKQYIRSISNPNHQVIVGGHPSPAGAPHGRRFFCRQYFEKANAWLTQNGSEEIDWSLSNSCGTIPKACNWTWSRRNNTSFCHSECPNPQWEMAPKSAFDDILAFETNTNDIIPDTQDVFRPFSSTAFVPSCKYYFSADNGELYPESLYLDFLEDEIRSRIRRSKGAFDVTVTRECPGRADEALTLNMNSDFLYILGIDGIRLESDIVKYSNDELELSRQSLDSRFSEALRFTDLSKTQQQNVLKMFAFVVAEGARFNHVESAVKNFLSSSCSYDWTEFSRLVRRWKTLSIFANTRGIARGEQHVGGSRAFLIVPISNYVVRTYNSAVSEGWQVTRSRYNVRVSDSPILLSNSNCEPMVVQ